MLMPMMGLLFTLFLAGVWNAAVLGALSFIRPLRFLRYIIAYFSLIPIFSSITAFCLSWSFGIGLETMFSTDIGGVGFYFGYLLGLFIGACLGLYVGYRLHPFKLPNLRARIKTRYKWVIGVCSTVGVFFLLLLAFLFLSFTPLIFVVRNQSKLYGTYLADYEFATEKVTINKDGTFVQEVTLKATSKVDTAKGTWKYYPEDGDFTFDHNFMSVMDGFKQLKPDYDRPRDKGRVMMPAYRMFFRIYMGSCEGVLYKKIE